MAAGGCGARATTTIASGVGAEGSDDSASRLGALQLVVEAWPDGSGDLGAENMVDGRLETRFVVAPDLRSPWNFVFRIVAGTEDVAAIGVPLSGSSADPRELTVFTSTGSWELTHETWATFVESAERHGMGVAPATQGVVVFALPRWTPARLIWVRVHTSRGDMPVQISEIYAFSADQLVRLRQAGLPGYEIRDLHAIDTEPYQGINITGLPNLDGPDLSVDEASGDAAEGSE